jgi:hypothetical protein
MFCGKLFRRFLTRSADGVSARSVSSRVKTLRYRALNLFSKRSRSSSTPLTNSVNATSAGRGASRADRCARPARPLGFPSPVRPSQNRAAGSSAETPSSSRTALILA